MIATSTIAEQNALRPIMMARASALATSCKVDISSFPPFASEFFALRKRVDNDWFQLEEKLALGQHGQSTDATTEIEGLDLANNTLIYRSREPRPRWLDIVDCYWALRFSWANFQDYVEETDAGVRAAIADPDGGFTLPAYARRLFKEALEDYHVWSRSDVLPLAAWDEHNYEVAEYLVTQPDRCVLSD